MNYEEHVKRVERLRDAYYSLEKGDRIVLITELWNVIESAEDALFDYFAQMVDTEDFKATSKKTAKEELTQLVSELRRDK